MILPMSAAGSTKCFLPLVMMFEEKAVSSSVTRF